MEQFQHYQTIINDFYTTFRNADSSKLIIAIIVFSLFLLLRRVFALFVMKFVKSFFDKTENKIDDKAVDILLGPVSFIFLIIGFNTFLILLKLKTPFFTHVIKSLIVFDVFWVLYYLIDVFKDALFVFSKKYSRELSSEIANFFARVFKFIILSLAIVSILQVWGINISGFIASLGLGGLAFALAAKDVAANIFGSLAILADKAISVGEWIKVDNVEGTVYDIGMRTTKIRTFENSIITVPNQIIANSPIENFSRRGTRRIKMRVGLEYNTTNKQMQGILNDIRELIKNDPNISQNSTQIINFDQLGDSSLSIFIYIFTNTANWQKYLQIKEEINLKIITIVENHGASIAFPSQTIYIKKEDK
jgi:MscS family membrane protein